MNTDIDDPAQAILGLREELHQTNILLAGLLLLATRDMSFEPGDVEPLHNAIVSANYVAASYE